MVRSFPPKQEEISCTGVSLPFSLKGRVCQSGQSEQGPGQGCQVTVADQCGGRTSVEVSHL